MGILGHFCVGGKQLELATLAVLIEDLHGLLPACVCRTVQLPEITKSTLAWAVGSAHGLDQRPVAVFFAILVDAELSQEHAGNLSRLQNASKGVGFHYNHFSVKSR